MSSYTEVHTTTRDILAERISRKFKWMGEHFIWYSPNVTQAESGDIDCY